MSECKKYYWLKLKDDFFSNKRIKKLRRIAGGDTYTVIYLKMQLLSIKNNGVLVYEGIEDDFAEELALELDEDIDNVKVTLSFLQSNGMIEETEQDHFLMTETIKCIGSESESAERVRNHREAQKALQCNADVTECNADVTKCNTEKDIREKNKDTRVKKKEREIKKEASAPFVPPTPEEVKAYCLERNNSVDAQHFVDYYKANGWMVGKNPMQDWKAAVRSWETNGYRNKSGDDSISKFDGFDVETRFVRVDDG